MKSKLGDLPPSSSESPACPAQPSACGMYVVRVPLESTQTWRRCFVPATYAPAGRPNLRGQAMACASSS